MQHHAYLLIGERGSIDTYIGALFADAGIVVLGNPDVFVIEQSIFGVDDARALAERSLEKAFGERKVFVIHSEKFTPEAQNALLKTLEEPTPNTHFLVSARETHIFLPTLLSRFHLVIVGGELEETNEVKKFLINPLKRRLDFAKKFADAIKEGEGLPAGRQGAGALAAFLDQLLQKLRDDGAPIETQKKVVTMRTYARDSAAQARVILEHLALVI